MKTHDLNARARQLITGLVGFWIGTAVLRAGAETPSALADLVQRHAQELAAIEAATSNHFSQVLLSYHGSVGTLETEERRGGNLDGVLACRNEWERLNARSCLPTNISPHSALGNLQRAYGNRINELERERVLRRRILDQHYLQALDQLKRGYVRENKLSDAQAVQAEEQRIKTLYAEPVRRPAPRPQSEVSTKATWTPLDLNPVAWWKFDGDLTDSSGNGKTATTYHGTPAYLEGVNNSALLLDGNTCLDSGIVPAEEFSVSMWAREAATRYPNPGSVTYVGWHLSTFDGTWTGKWIVFVQNSTYGLSALYDNSFFIPEGNGNISGYANKWIHVVMTVCKTANNTCYTNGVKTSAVIPYTSVAANKIAIGGPFNRSDRYSYADIDDVMVFDRALTADEVKQIYEWRAK